MSTQVVTLSIKPVTGATISGQIVTADVVSTDDYARRYDGAALQGLVPVTTTDPTASAVRFFDGTTTWALQAASTGDKTDQTAYITAPNYKLPADGPFTVSATASSGLACTLTIVSGPATILNGTVTLTGTTGIVRVRAVQSGDASYNSVTVERDINVVDVIPVVKQSNTFGFSLGIGL